MQLKVGRTLYYLAVLVLAAIPGVAQNVTIYNNFLPGKTYECCGGEWVVGTTAAPTVGLAGAALAAGTFTPAGNFNLAQIDIALYFNNGYFGPYSGAVTLSLNQDSNGVPGAVRDPVQIY